MTIFRQRPQLGSGGNSEDMYTLRSHAFGACILQRHSQLRGVNGIEWEWLVVDPSLRVEG